MAQVDISINGRNYKVACDDGQETHLIELGKYVDERVGDLTNAVGQIGESRLLVMASLLIADELSEVQRNLHEDEERNGNSGETAPSIDQNSLIEGIETIADRIEGIADRLERA